MVWGGKGVFREQFKNDLPYQEWRTAMDGITHIIVIDAMANLRTPPNIAYDPKYSWDDLARDWVHNHFRRLLTAQGKMILVLCTDKTGDDLLPGEDFASEPRKYVRRRRPETIDYNSYAGVDLDDMPHHDSHGPFDFENGPSKEVAPSLYMLFSNRRWVYTVVLKRLGLALLNLFENRDTDMKNLLSVRPAYDPATEWQIILHGWKVSDGPVRIKLKPFAEQRNTQVRAQYGLENVSRVQEGDLSMLAWAHVLRNTYPGAPITICSIDGDLWLNTACFVHCVRTLGGDLPRLYVMQFPGGGKKNSTSWEEQIILKDWANLEADINAWYNVEATQVARIKTVTDGVYWPIDLFMVLAFYEHDYIPKTDGVGARFVEHYKKHLPICAPLVTANPRKADESISFTVHYAPLRRLLVKPRAEAYARSKMTAKEVLYVQQAMEFVLHYASNDPLRIQTDMTVVDKFTGEPFYGFVRTEDVKGKEVIASMIEFIQD